MSEMNVAEVDNYETWTNPERDFATKSLGLVKVTHLCLMRIHKALTAHGSCATSTHCAQLDKVVAVVREVSPALDDFVSELYHPINFPEAIENVGRLVSVVRQVVCSVRGSHLEAGLDKLTANKLLQGLGHNHSKLDPSVTDPVTQFNNLSINS